MREWRSAVWPLILLLLASSLALAQPSSGEVGGQGQEPVVKPDPVRLPPRAPVWDRPLTPAGALSGIRAGGGLFVPADECGVSKEPGFEFYVGTSLEAAFTASGAHYLFRNGTGGVAVVVTFPGSTGSPPRGTDPRATRFSFFTGGDPRPDLPTFGSVTYEGLWPGVDLTYHGTPGGLKYELRVAEGADSSQVRCNYSGVDGLALQDAGRTLVLATPPGDVRDAGLKVFEECTGRELGAAFELLGGSEVGFAIDRAGAGALIIDPLVYSTFLGGASDDVAADVAVDQYGAVYVAGYTDSSGFPTVPGSFDTTFTLSSNAFVSKLDPDGSTLNYSTFYGQSSDGIGCAGIAVDVNGSAYITGSTGSGGIPTTANAFNSTWNTYTDAFVAKLCPNGTWFDYSSYLGGDSHDNGQAIAVDENGSAYVTGYTLGGTTDPGQFPRTFNAPQRTKGGDMNNQDAFLTKISPDGSTMLNSTYIGGSYHDMAYSVAVNASTGVAYVTGYTGSTDFPTVSGSYDETFQLHSDAFLTIVSADGTTFDYGTYLGSDNFDGGEGVAVDRHGDVYLTGWARPTDVSVPFPTTPGAFRESINAGATGTNWEDAFLTKISPDGNGASDLVYSTFLGGYYNDQGTDIAVDADGCAYVTGWTLSSDFPTVPGSYDRTYGSGQDAFLAKVSPNGGALMWGSYIGGSDIEIPYGVAIAGNATVFNDTRLVIAGSTESSNFPTTSGALDEGYGGGGYMDAFVTVFHNVSELEPPNIAPHAPTSLDINQNFSLWASVVDNRPPHTPGVLTANVTFGGVEFAMSNHTNSNFTWSTTALTDTTWRVSAWTVDGYGNETAFYDLVVGDVPNIQVPTAPSRAVHGDVITVSVDVTDERPGDVGLAWVKIIWDDTVYYMTNSSAEPDTFSWAHAVGEAEGTFYWLIIAGDWAGNTNSTSEYRTKVVEEYSAGDGAEEEGEEGKKKEEEVAGFSDEDVFWAAVFVASAAASLLVAKLLPQYVAQDIRWTWFPSTAIAGGMAGGMLAASHWPWWAVVLPWVYVGAWAAVITRPELTGEVNVAAAGFLGVGLLGVISLLVNGWAGVFGYYALSTFFVSGVGASWLVLEEFELEDPRLQWGVPAGLGAVGAVLFVISLIGGL